MRRLGASAVVVLLGLIALLPAAGCGEDSNDAGAGTGATPTGDFEITGRWVGTLHQLGLGSFDVEAEIRSLETAEENTVSYTVIDCSGTWDYRGMDGSAYRFHELIDAGAGGDCKGAGTVTLTPAGEDELEYSFSGEGIESRGTLERAPD